MNAQHVEECGVAEQGRASLRVGEDVGEDAMHEQSPFLSPSACSGHRQTDSDAGRGAGQDGMNHQRKMNADDDPVGNLMGGNETPAFEEKPPQKGFIRPFLAMF